MAKLEIIDLSASAEGKQILKHVNILVPEGETHVLMGPNGSGKSTLSNVILGNPQYEMTSGKIKVGDVDISDMTVDDRAGEGLFLAFQHPESISGVSVTNFLRQAMSKRKKVEDFSVLEVRLAAMDWASKLGMDTQFIERYLNEGFSGGEKKRNEIFQMAMLEPKIAILDETDSGLDIDALRIVANGVNKLKNENNAVLVITHYQRLLDYIVPDFVHVLMDGKIVKTGGADLALELEEKGYDWIKNELV